MKIRIEIDESKDEEIIIKCKKVTDDIYNIQNLIKQNISNKIKLLKNNKEYYIELDKILFFETDIDFVSAHTVDEIFQTKYKLYELEEILSNNFMRISKSTIININHIYSINRNLTSSSVVEFNGTLKKVYVSRLYYKLLKDKIEGRILNEKR